MLGLAGGMAGQAELGKALSILVQEVRCAGVNGKEREETKSSST